MSADENLNDQQFGYRMQHQPTFGKGIHEIDQEMPDYHEHPEYYRYGDPAVDSEAEHAARKARRGPDTEVKIYRSAPKGVNKVNPGDWVTTSKTYAKQHGMGAADDGGNWPVRMTWAKAHEVQFGGNDAVEWGYNGTKSMPTYEVYRGTKGKRST